MTADIVTTQPTGIIHSMDDAMKAAQAMAASGFFQDARQAAQAVVKILAGQELGVGPFTAMTGVYIIQGRPALSANLMAAAVKRSGRYNFRVAELTDARCEIIFFEGGQECGRSSFTAEEARKAGTKNMDKYPRNMLYARAISNGVRWFCPDVLGGSPVYTPEELGASVNEDGQVIDVQPEPVEPASRAGLTQPADDAPSSALMARWGQLCTEAEGLGIPVAGISPEITATELTDRGKALRRAIDQAKSTQRDPDDAPDEQAAML
jgi:hypothetical protein